MSTSVVTSYAELAALSGSDGDFAIWGALTMQYSAVVSDWIPAKCNRGPFNVLKAVGSENSSALTTAGWTVTTSGTGTVTTDGTKITIDGSAASGDTAYIDNDPSFNTSMKSYGSWFQGRVQAGTPDASASNFKNFNRIACLDTATGTFDKSFTLQVGTANQLACFHTTSAQIGFALPSTETDLTTEAFLVIIWQDYDSGGSTDNRSAVAYVDGVLHAFYWGKGWPATAADDLIRIGDDTTGANDGGSVIIRNVITGMYTRPFARHSF